MAKAHGKDTVITLDGDDLSTYINASEFTTTVDKHDVTGYGAENKAYSLGLGDATFTMSGVYDTAAAGPRGVIVPIRDAKAAVTLVRRPEGTGSGKPNESVSVLVEQYVESNPVADVIAWSCECQCTGDVTTTTQ
jgi:hypothetical protein